MFIYASGLHRLMIFSNKYASHSLCKVYKIYFRQCSCAKYQISCQQQTPRTCDWFV